MRSGVVAVEHSHGKHLANGLLIIRGAAAVIEQQVGTDRLPPNYRKVSRCLLMLTWTIVTVLCKCWASHYRRTCHLQAVLECI